MDAQNNNEKEFHRKKRSTLAKDSDTKQGRKRNTVSSIKRNGNRIKSKHFKGVRKRKQDKKQTKTNKKQCINLGQLI